MKDLLMVIPSRGRPHNIVRLWETMAATCKGDTTLLVGLDDDDPTRAAYPEGPQYVVRSGLRQVVAWINELAIPHVDEYKYIGHMGDDNVPRTDAWDVRIMESLEQTPFAFGNDLYPREPGSLSCHVFARSEVIKALGYFGPPSIKHMYVDVVWMDWGNATGITYLDDVILEHMHYTAGKAPADESYVTSTSLIPSDFIKYNEYCADRLASDVEKIKRVTGQS